VKDCIAKAETDTSGRKSEHEEWMGRHCICYGVVEIHLCVTCYVICVMTLHLHKAKPRHCVMSKTRWMDMKTDMW